MIGIITALFAGLLMSFQGVFNTQVRNASDTWVSNVWVHFSGLLACLAVWFFASRQNLFGVFSVENKLYLSGGLIGAFIIYTVIKSISDLGRSFATMLILPAQLVTACLIEGFGWFGVEKISFTWGKIVGVVLMISGIVIFKLK